jgi:hypothetical protein
MGLVKISNVFPFSFFYYTRKTGTALPRHAWSRPAAQPIGFLSMSWTTSVFDGILLWNETSDSASLEASVPQQQREATRRRFLDSLPDSPLFLAVGSLFFGTDVLGERRIRWVMYVSSSNRVVLPRIKLDFLPVEMSSVSFCPLSESWCYLRCMR